MKEFKPGEGVEIPEWIERLQRDGWEMVNSKTGPDGRIRSALFRKKGSGS